MRREKKKLSPSDPKAAGVSRELVVRRVRGRSELSLRRDNLAPPGTPNPFFTHDLTRDSGERKSSEGGLMWTNVDVTKKRGAST